MGLGTDLALAPAAACWSIGGSREIRAGALLALVDIDGTLSDPGHRRHLLNRHPPDWEAFSLEAGYDPPIAEGVEWVRRISMHLAVAVVSGRPSYAMSITKRWLHAHSIPWDFIALRPSLDALPGPRHKLRVLEALVAAGLTPVIAADDSVDLREIYEGAGLRFVLIEGHHCSGRL